MTELDRFIVRGHQKIIEHYRRLRDRAPSDLERERFHRCMQQEERALREFFEQRSPSVRAA
jgi:hypothetical protein